eukprot:6175177-Pleurochrysis_carterae.AAC.4
MLYLVEGKIASFAEFQNLPVMHGLASFAVDGAPTMHTSGDGGEDSSAGRQPGRSCMPALSKSATSFV